MMTLSILSYAKWNTATPTLCVIENDQATLAFSQAIRTQGTTIQLKNISSDQLSTKPCDAVFFNQTSPEAEQRLINQSLNKSVLSFSNNNSECEIGSVFCLYTSKNGNTLFKVNLDSLAKSRIHVDPRVLLLAKNTE